MTRTSTSVPVETLEARLALKLTAALSESSAELPHDISERLRLARENALRVRRPEAAVASEWQRSGAAAALNGGGGRNRLSRLAAWLPLIVLVSGLYLIRHQHGQSQVSAAADVDAVLLADDLPPDAYTDAGFLEFLKLPPP